MIYCTAPISRSMPPRITAATRSKWRRRRRAPNSPLRPRAWLSAFKNLSIFDGLVASFPVKNRGHSFLRSFCVNNLNLLVVSHKGHKGPDCRSLIEEKTCYLPAITYSPPEVILKVDLRPFLSRTDLAIVEFPPSEDLTNLVRGFDALCAICDQTKFLP